MAREEAISATVRSHAGGRVLSLLSDPLNASILRALMSGPLQVSELGELMDATSRTTRFARLRELEQLGVIVRERRAGTPPVAFCRLSPAGLELLQVVRRFANWLAASPTNPSSPDDVRGAQTIKALGLAWETTVLRSLADRPRSLTELASMSPPDVTYHEVRRARESLSEAGLVVSVGSEGRAQPYVLVDWARRAAGCVAASIRWEKSFAGSTASTGPVDVGTLLLLLLPLVNPPARLSGACMLQIDQPNDFAATVDSGSIVAHPPGQVDIARESRVSGPADAWLAALLDGKADSLAMRGGIHLTTALTNALHDASRPATAPIQANGD
jgi:DNA-binding HxlR family transcriptional regulator